MKYKDLLKLYKDGTLTEDEKRKLEQEIEKFEAIEEYLMEDDINVDDAFANDAEYFNEETSEKDKLLSDAINRSVKKAMIKMGTAITVVLVLIAILGMTIFPKTTNVLWYQPNTPVEGTHVNRMSVDLAVHTELSMPGKYFTQVNAIDEGYGKYRLEFIKNLYDANGGKSIYGELVRNDLNLYNQNDFELPYYNAFRIEDYINEPEDTSKRSIEELNDSQYYTSYITFKNAVSYSDARSFGLKYEPNKEIWIGIDTGSPLETNYLLGMNIGNSGNVGYLQQEYPYLIGIDKDLQKKSIEMADPEKAQQHFISMLEYMNDRVQFTKVMDVYEYQQQRKDAIKYVKKNGMNSYGISITTNKETLLNILKDENVERILVDRR